MREEARRVRIPVFCLCYTAAKGNLKDVDGPFVLVVHDLVLSLHDL